MLADTLDSLALLSADEAVVAAALLFDLPGLRVRLTELPLGNAVVALEAQDTLKETPRQYLNRLSDLMFVLSRVLNRFRTDGTVGDDVYWKSAKLAQAEST